MNNQHDDTTAPLPDGAAASEGRKPFSWRVRVYHEDTDGQGIVYYANYMRFMERSRTEWLRALGVDQVPLRDEHGLIFVVVDVELHYRRPARYGELLEVTCVVEERTRATLIFRQEVRRDRLDGELLVEGRVRIACLDADKHQPRLLPKPLWEKLI
jgi:tol-pal system-associated acyl-CoA thioesterase